MQITTCIEPQLHPLTHTTTHTHTLTTQEYSSHEIHTCVCVCAISQTAATLSSPLKNTRDMAVVSGTDRICSELRRRAAAGAFCEVAAKHDARNNATAATSKRAASQLFFLTSANLSFSWSRRLDQNHCIPLATRAAAAAVFGTAARRFSRSRSLLLRLVRSQDLISDLVSRDLLHT